MYDAEQTFATWVQAIAAIVALIIAIIQVVQVKRIKELSDVVSRLQRQNELMDKQLQLQHALALYEKAPFFRFDGNSYTPTPNERKFRIMNEGLDAFRFNLENPHDHFAARIDNVLNVCRNQCCLDLTINYAHPVEKAVGFWIHYESSNGISFRQFILYEHESTRILIDNPEVTFAPKPFRYED
jgi:hypothetical protein